MLFLASQVITLLWLIRILFNVLSFVNLWFVKEYRGDRMLIHLRTPQGKRIYFLPWRRPPVSPKTILVTISTIVVLFTFYLYINVPTLLKLLLIDIMSFPITAIIVFILKIPTYIYHAYLKSEAVNKLRIHKPMIVIGITGSFGKTSTKEYLSTILSSRFSVLKTEASKNSPIGIAEVVVKNLKPEHEIFIVEMGAYKKGEIKEMSEMVQPQIGIITAINAQHQDLFGSIENTIKAKYELIDGLVGKKIGIFNVDNAFVLQMANQAQKDGKEIWGVGSGEVKKKFSKLFMIKDARTQTKGIEFILVEKDSPVTVAAPVYGTHQSTNIALAIAAAVACGMNMKDAVGNVHHIQPFKKTMEPGPGINGSLFINDTFNNNPDAALAAVKYLRQQTGKKYLVFQPMIELGTYASTSHEEIGESAALACDHIILTNNNFNDSFMTGVKKSGRNIAVFVLKPHAAADYITAHVQKGDTVLFKGKEAESVLRMIKK